MVSFQNFTASLQKFWSALCISRHSKIKIWHKFISEVYNTNSPILPSPSFQSKGKLHLVIFLKYG